MSYNGYTNEATYTADLLVSNEYKVYVAARAIAREHGMDAKTAAPYIRGVVTRALKGQTDLLTASQREAWNADIARSGGLRKVDWVEIAEVQGRERRKSKSGMLRTKSRAARRSGKR